MKTALVTGDMGFVGRHVRARLEADGWRVIGCDIKRSGSRSSHSASREDDCRTLFMNSLVQYDLVVHCAAVVGGRATIDNEPLKVATDLAIDADFFQFVERTKPGRSVYFSSSAAYPVKYQDAQAQREHGRLTEAYFGAGDPDGIYGRVKVIGEYQAGLIESEVTIFRPFSGYGSDQDLDYPFPTFIQRALRRDDPFVVWGSASQTRDWIHIDDIVECVIASLDLPPMTVNLCSGVPTALGDLAVLCARAAGYWIDTVHVDADKPMGVFHRVGDPAKMAASGLPAPRVSLEEGISRAIHHAQGAVL